jgi:NAD(P)-dependent dehydrogenase (short-subunit alcohol dehydrogenase family)
MEHAGTAALIVGGTQGLGLAIARRLRAEGAGRIVVTGRDAAKGAAAAEAVGAAFLPADLETDDMAALVDAAAERLGGLNALCVAGALTDRGSILDTSPALWDRMMAANARAPFFALQRFARRAVADGQPASAVMILSMVIHCGQSFLAPYSAAKAALANVTKNAAQALRQHRIRVNGIACGWMDTPGEDATQRRFHGAGPDWLAEAEARQPFSMLVKPDHVAGLAAYLLGPASGVMTGSIVDFDQNVAGAYPE